MTKQFRVQEQVGRLLDSLRSPGDWPVNFYELLSEYDIDPMESALWAVTPDQGCLCIGLIDQNRRLIEFELEYDGAPWEAKAGAIGTITAFIASDLDTDNSWWQEHPRMTMPKSNNPILAALQLLGEDWKPQGQTVFR